MVGIEQLLSNTQDLASDKFRVVSSIESGGIKDPLQRAINKNSAIQFVRLSQIGVP